MHTVRNEARNMGPLLGPGSGTWDLDLGPGSGILDLGPGSWTWILGLNLNIWPGPGSGTWELGPGSGPLGNTVLNLLRDMSETSTNCFITPVTL